MPDEMINEEVTAPTLEATPTDVIVDVWFMENYSNRGHTVEEYNRVREATFVLKARLNAVNK